MSILSDMASDKKDFTLKEGKHVAMIKSADYKVLEKSGTEVVNMKLMLQDGTTHFHSFFAHTEGSLKMAAPQLNKLMLLEKLPIYKSVNDLIADRTNFLKKLETALNGLLNKKVELTVESYNSKKTGQKEQMVRISGYLDIPNEAVQTVPKAKVDPLKNDRNEELGF
jgi:hypothetical protein